MPQRPLLPKSASVADMLEDGRLNAPSAERNAKPITEILQRYAPKSGRALEIASGTGQHAVVFASTVPGLIWQPTEIDAQRRASIDAWASLSGLPNLKASVSLDATAPGWAARHGNQALIVLVNLLHLISKAEARTIIAEALPALSPGGRFILYGPFLRDGVAVSDADKRFDASLRSQDPEIGYKSDTDVIRWIKDAELTMVDTVEMPANNLVFVCERPG